MKIVHFADLHLDTLWDEHGHPQTQEGWSRERSGGDQSRTGRFEDAMSACTLPEALAT